MKKNLSPLAALAVVLTAVAACSKTPGGDKPGPAPVGPKTGEVITPWTEGQLDIHFINTTTGECTFFIFPDGTQMLIDAAGSNTGTGAVGSTTNTGIRARWDPTKDANFRCGKYIADYIAKCMEWTGNGTLDYAVLTHLHNDHFGGYIAGQTPQKNGYYWQSFIEVMDTFPTAKLLDRGYPEYNYPFDMASKPSNSSNCRNYINAVKWMVANKGLVADKVKAGSSSQIVPVKNPGAYPDFKVQNLAVNGDVWTGSGEESRSTFPELSKIQVANPKSVASTDNCPEENHCSAAFRISYGKFDLFHGGDLQYDGVSSFSWKDIETPVAKVCGAVDVMKADHHGTSNTNGWDEKKGCMAMKYLNPKCWIVNSWTDGHPRVNTYNTVSENLPGILMFITNSCTEQEAYNAYTHFVKGRNGHILVRVDKGGDSYNVYSLSDSDAKMTVQQICGPYKSR